jgi:hypothetical protein
MILKTSYVVTILSILLVFQGCFNSTPGTQSTQIDKNTSQPPPTAKPTPAQPSPPTAKPTPTQPPPPPKSKPKNRNEASAFLSRATFGSTQESIEHLLSLPDYDAWFREQFKKSPTYHLKWVYNHAKGVGGVGDLKDNPDDWQPYSDALGDMQLDAWWDIVVNGKDQLRQRVAFALSEIFVVSKRGALGTFPDARISFYDTLIKYAFGNFYNLLKAVTYHPAMGKYLSYLGNAKAGVFGAHPDENYAREVMQLFSIGLYMLNDDGTYQIDANGTPKNSYTQNDVTQMAKVFTGLSDDNGQFPVEAAFNTHRCRTVPMRAFESYHDKSEKVVLGSVIPQNQKTKKDIDMALRILFEHPNTPPFICKQLIQRLVTSNPSADYIKRVSAVFKNNGKGKRGDMKAVIKAILTDSEALEGAKKYPKTFGKFREPLLYVSHLFRAMDAENGVHTLKQEDQPLYRYRSFNLHETGILPQEGPLSSLTVFNYFTPEDGPYSLKKEHLVAPELTLYGKGGIDDFLMDVIHEGSYIYQLYEISAELNLEKIKNFLDKKEYQNAINHLNMLLCAGHLSKQSRKDISDYLKNETQTDTEALARHLLGLVITSPDYALQR